jgi:YD repeat-containing protein
MMNTMKIQLSFCLVAAVLLITTATAHSVVVNYTYDGAGRLIAADYGFGKNIAYTYDLNGNILKQSVQFNIADAVRILQLLTRVQSSAPVSVSGDVNTDGKIGMAEIIFTLQALSGLREW